MDILDRASFEHMRATLNHSVAILGTGSYLPERIVGNDELRGLCSNYDEDRSGDFGTWVDRVTHIHRRHYIAPDETAADMATTAAKRALDMAGVKAEELDLIIHASFTPSNVVPGDHVLVAQALGATRTPSFTLTAACSGSVHGMAMAYGMLASGTMKRILVTGSETISPTLDFGDLLTTILFGDGAGAVVLGNVGSCEGGVFAPLLGFDFNYENIVMNNANLPFTSQVRVPAANGTPPAIEKEYLRMRSGRSVLRSAVNTMAGAVKRVLGHDGKARVEGELAEDLSRLRLIAHQANGRIVDGLAKKLGISALKTTKPIYHMGNISAASNVIALDFAMRHGNLIAKTEPETGRILEVKLHKDPIEKGELVVVPTIGAGYLYGAFGFIHAG